MYDTVIKIENLSKQYRLGLIGTGTLSHDLRRWWFLVRGKEDPYLKVGETNERSVKGNSEYVWALKDINLEVKQGEVLGIIGKNGAGKSTLLKILSKVTAPTTGSIHYKGRIGSLLEVGTGFHQELTGRENIYLNGAILGMHRKEIDRKFDEIVDFSGCERYIDTPVKRYSSGMMVRLGFAVAAHLDPEILVVDEVLAVGDAEFQKKAIGKMKDVSRMDGRTVLFVSHNMTAIRQLCDNSILIQNGKVVLNGHTSQIIEHYLQNTLTFADSFEDIDKILKTLPEDEAIRIEKISFLQDGINLNKFVKNGSNFEIEISYEVFENTTGLRIYVDICDDEGILLFRSFNDEDNDEIPQIKKGKYISRVTIPANIFAPVNYELQIQAGIYNIRYCFPKPISIPFKVEHTGLYNRAYVTDTIRGKFAMTLKWINSKT